jgi:hypothetical protein
MGRHIQMNMEQAGGPNPKQGKNMRRTTATDYVKLDSQT